MSPASGVLWASPLTTCSRRVIAACVEAGADFSFVPIHLPKVEHKLPAFLALNPYGKVPAWRDASGFDLFESRAIMQHVCDGTALVPSSPKERALMNQWLWVDQCSFKPAFDPIFYQKVLKKAPLNEEQCAASKVELEATLDVMEAALSKSGLDYLASAAFTMADLTYLCYFQVFGPAGLADTLETRPMLKAWWERCSARKAWQYTLGMEFVEEKKLAEDPLGREKPWDP
jgi:glutathione S-transferase